MHRVLAIKVLPATKASCSTLQHYLHSDSRAVVEQLTLRMEKLAEQERFEDAAQIRNRLSALVSGISRGQRIRAFTQIPKSLPRIDTTATGSSSAFAMVA
jgi:excinuclease UvrABC nuclease subunit